jgi:lipid-binding SYLF domain-containing protein
MLFKRMLIAVSLLVIFLGITAPLTHAASANKINSRVDQELRYFRQNVDGAPNYLSNAKGVLVFPRVYKAGLGLGGEYGEGALRVNGRTVDYYNTIAGSYGFQIGAQKKAVIILFMDQESLTKFRNSSNWEAGADASIALIEVGAGKTVDTNTIKDPVLGFVVNQKGLMAGVSLKGMKISKIDR